MGANQKLKKIICLHAGPGAGKSTLCAGLYYHLKMLNFNCEMNREYIKDWVWEGRDIRPGDQTYFFSKQSRRERIYIEQWWDFIITDAPLILNYFYGQKYDTYEQKYNTIPKMLKNHHSFCKDHGYKTEHFFIERTKAYNPAGRLQTKEESILYDEEVKRLLERFKINYHCIQSGKSSVKEILQILDVS